VHVQSDCVQQRITEPIRGIAFVFKAFHWVDQQAARGYSAGRESMARRCAMGRMTFREFK
jgi:hypothetical protein